MTKSDEYFATCKQYYALHRAKSLLTDIQNDLISIGIGGEAIGNIDRAAALLGYEMRDKESRCMRIADAIKAERKDNGKENLD